MTRELVCVDVDPRLKSWAVIEMSRWDREFFSYGLRLMLMLGLMKTKGFQTKAGLFSFGKDDDFWPFRPFCRFPIKIFNISPFRAGNT